MARLKLLTLTVCVALGGAGRGDAQDTDQHAFVRKAIEAHGGEENLKKYSATTTKFKGSVELLGQMREFSGELSCQRPDKFKLVSSVIVNGQTFQSAQGFNGKVFWISQLGKTTEIKDEKIIKQTRYTVGVNPTDYLVSLFDKECELNTLGEFKVKDCDAFGIRISKKGEPDISLFFDKKTHLLVKTEMRLIDAAIGQEVTQEEFLLDPKDVGGVKTASRFIIHKDGKHLMELEFSETQYLEKLDDAHFAMP